MISELSESTDGFGNGHAQIMIAGIPQSDFCDLLHELYIHSEETPICDLKISDDQTSLTAQIHTKDFECLWFLSLSHAYPKATFYWNDCWEDSSRLYLAKAGMRCNSALYTATILYDEFAEEYNNELYFNIEVEIKDRNTGATMVIGGGGINEAQREALYLLCLRSSTDNPMAKKKGDMEAENSLYELLKAHAGHTIEIAEYGDGVNFALEDMDTNEVIFDTDCYDLVAIA